MRLLILLVALCVSHYSLAEPAFRVVTTVAPITDLVTRVAAGRALVQGVIPEGVNSHTFEPAPSTARHLAQADLIVANGLFLELPMLHLAERVRRSTTEIVRLGDQAIAKSEWRFDFSFPQAAGHPNPHLWPNVALTQRYVQLIQAALAKLDPQGRALYQGNAETLLAQLQQLDQKIFTCVQSIPSENRRLVTYHDSFAYFAPRYGMEVVGAIQPSDFSEPSPRELVRIIEQLRRLRVPAVFGSEVFPSPVLKQIARESGAQFVDQLRDDDLPGEPGEARHSYIGMMAENLRVITRALGGDPECMATLP